MEERVIDKHLTGIPGFDAISNGGLPRGRTTLIAGSAGSGKTVFTLQFVAEGIRSGEAGVFVTFEETPDDIRSNVTSLGWPLAEWEDEGMFAFVDASPTPGREEVVIGEYDLGALVSRIEYAVENTGAQRVALDSLGAVFAHYEDGRIVRAELRRLAMALRTMGVTSVFTAERRDEYGEISREGLR